MHAKRACVFVPDGGCSRVPDRAIYTTFTTSVVIVWSNTTVAVPVTVPRSSQGEATSPGRTLVPSTSAPPSSTARTGLPTSPTGVARPSSSASATMTASPSAPTPALTAPLTLTSTATWTPFTDTSGSPASSYSSANTTSASSPTHMSSSGAPQSPVPSTTRAAPAHLPTHLTAPAFAGTVASVALTATVAAALVRLWVRRRRRARARVRPELLLTQEPGELGRPTAERAPCARILPSHARGGDTESGACTQGQSLVSGSERGAQDGSAATAVERTPSGSSPEIISVESKGGGSASASGGQEPFGSAASESFHEQPSIDLPDASRYDVPQTDVSADDPEIMVEDAQGERLLHLALPWVLGQRVLAFIAREDARSVESGGLEELPAYEPRE